MSETYQQSSQTNEKLEERDQYNRLLARQSARRLPAELIRDNALAIAGILNTRIGGRSVRPYQPKDYYQHLNFPVRRWHIDRDENQYRRGLYTHWQRTFLHPMLLTFDAPSRDECAASRPVSNTPLQALTLLNDPVYVEAARALAQRVLAECDGRPLNEQLDYAFRLCTARFPGEREREVLRELYADQLAVAREDPEAAWYSVATALLNLHETITKE
jgi:hypothetical protein